MLDPLFAKHALIAMHTADVIQQHPESHNITEKISRAVADVQESVKNIMAILSEEEQDELLELYQQEVAAIKAKKNK